MENKNFEHCVNQINDNPKIKESITKTIYHHLGVNVNLIAKNCGKYIELTDKGDDVDNKLRGNKLLRAIFSSGYIYGTAWEESESGNIYITLHISYTHPGGGSNGRELGKILVKSNGKSVFLKR